MASRYWHAEHLEVPAELAQVVHDVIAGAVRRARRDGMYPDARLLDWLADLERLAARRHENRPASPPMPAIPTPAPRWITTAEAAAVLGIGERAMRRYAGRITSRNVGKKRLWLESDVADEADARAEYRNPSEPSGTGADAA